MTGYDGVLGYRTDIAYKTGKNCRMIRKIPERSSGF